MTDRSYKQLSRLRTWDERFDYLNLNGAIGERTFGGERWLNQDFYRSRQWKDIRNHVIARDLGCDLGLEGHDIFDQVIIHHMNPMSRDQVARGDDVILDPEFLITVTHSTHNAIHYGNKQNLARPYVERTPGDTSPWTR